MGTSEEAELVNLNPHTTESKCRF